MSKLHHIEGPDLYLEIARNGLFKLAEEFADAKYQLNPNEFKIWVTFACSFDQFDNEKKNSFTKFTFNAIEMADRLRIDKRKARGTIIFNLMDSLSDRKITLRKRYADREDDADSIHFLADVSYRSDTKLITIWIPERMMEYLVHLKQGTYLPLDLNDILLIDGMNPIKLFIYLKNLERQCITEISVEQMREELDVGINYSYKDFKKKILLPCTKEIKKHTQYKEFYFEDDARRGFSATTIRFGFFGRDDEPSDVLLSNVSPAMRKHLLEKFNKQVCQCLHLAVEQGFNPRFINQQLDGFKPERIIANVNLVLKRIYTEKKAGQDKGPDVYGKYFIPAIVQNWAGDNAKTLQEGKARLQNMEIQQRTKDVADIENEQNRAIFCYNRAKEYVSGLSLSELMKFEKSHKHQLQNLCGRYTYDPHKAHSRKKNYREYRALCRCVSGMMQSGELKINIQQPLFMLSVKKSNR